MDNNNHDPHEHDPPSDGSNNEPTPEPDPTEDPWGATPPPDDQQPGSYSHDPYSGGSSSFGTYSHNTSWEYFDDTNSQHAQPPPSEPTDPPEARNFQIGDAFGTAWRTFAKKPLQWLGISLILCVLIFGTLFCGFIVFAISSDISYHTLNPSQAQRLGLTFFALFIAGGLLSMILNALLHRAAVAEMRGKPGFDKFFRLKELHVPGFVLMQTVLGILTVVGLVGAFVLSAFIATFAALACAHYALNPAQGVGSTLRSAFKTVTRNPVALLVITIVFSLINFFSSALPFLLIPLFPLEIMVIVYLAMLSNHERPAYAEPPPPTS